MVHFLSQLNNWTTVKDSVKIFDVGDTDITRINLQSWKIYSKFRIVYVVIKNDKEVDGGPEQGVFIKYSAVKTGNAPEKIREQRGYSTWFGGIRTAGGGIGLRS